jgi:hypothetical protein
MRAVQYPCNASPAFSVGIDLLAGILFSDGMWIGVPASGLGLKLLRHNKFAACIGFGCHDDVDADFGFTAWC